MDGDEKIDLKKLITVKIVDQSETKSIVAERVKRSEGLFSKYVINFISI